MSDLPHDGVWARLAVSAIHGVGVVAICAIPAGTNVFANDSGAISWLTATQIAALPATSPVKRLYDDFAIRRGNELGCPLNFNMMGVGWYVNQPASNESANLMIGQDFAMIASRDIAEGEELTIDYGTFSV